MTDHVDRDLLTMDPALAAREFVARYAPLPPLHAVERGRSFLSDLSVEDKHRVLALNLALVDTPGYLELTKAMLEAKKAPPNGPDAETASEEEAPPTREAPSDAELDALGDLLPDAKLVYCEVLREHDGTANFFAAWSLEQGLEFEDLRRFVEAIGDDASVGVVADPGVPGRPLPKGLYVCVTLLLVASTPTVVRVVREAPTSEEAWNWTMGMPQLGLHGIHKRQTGLAETHAEVVYHAAAPVGLDELKTLQERAQADEVYVGGGTVTLLVLLQVGAGDPS